MARSRHVARQRDALTVDIRASAPCEFLLHLSESASPSAQASTTLGKVWFDTCRAAVEPDLTATIDLFSDPAPGAPLQLWSRFLPLAYDTPPPHDVPTFLAHFSALSPLQVRLNLLGYYDLWPDRAASPEVTLLAAQGGDEWAIQEAAATHFPSDQAHRAALVALLMTEPAETRARLLAIMRRWYEAVFRDQEAAIMAILERDAQATRLLGRALAPGELVETVTNGIEFQPWPGLQRLALLPTYVMRPWTEHLYRNDLTIFCYPASDDSLAEVADGPPARLIKLHQALGDERRLRILRYLATEQAAFQEVASALDLPKSSLHYHLGILRSAGLLRVGGGARGTLYSLRRESLKGMDEALLRYFEGDTR